MICSYSILLCLEIRVIPGTSQMLNKLKLRKLKYMYTLIYFKITTDQLQK